MWKRSGQNTKEESDNAAAHLYRLAQAAAMLRMYHNAEGHEPASIEDLADWLKQQHLTGRIPPGPIKPLPEDHDEVSRENPELVKLSNLWNPYLTGKN